MRTQPIHFDCQTTSGVQDSVFQQRERDRKGDQRLERDDVSSSVIQQFAYVWRFFFLAPNSSVRDEAHSHQLRAPCASRNQNTSNNLMSLYTSKLSFVMRSGRQRNNNRKRQKKSRPNRWSHILCQWTELHHQSGPKTNAWGGREPRTSPLSLGHFRRHFGAEKWSHRWWQRAVYGSSPSQRRPALSNLSAALLYPLPIRSWFNQVERNLRN